MRVLHLYAGNLYGGIERLLVTLARERRHCPDMEPHFGVCFEGRLAVELRAEGVAVHALGDVRFSRPWTVWRARRRLAALLAERPFDVVVAHAAWPHAVFGAVVRAAGLPLVFWLHSRTDGRHWTERRARRVRPDLVLAVSRSTAETAERIHPGVPTTVYYSPLSLPAAEPARADAPAVRAELGVPADATVIIQVSRMEAWKGHVPHLEALGRLRDVPGWVCWQVGGAQHPGERAYVEQLQAMAQRLGIADRVRFLGERADVARLLAAADVYCQPNLGPEGFSIAFMEAFTAGLPIVTSRLGGAPELVDETCGVLTTPGAVAEVVEALRSLVADPPLRRQMGDRARRRVRELCDPASQVPRLAELLRGVQRRGGSPKRVPDGRPPPRPVASSGKPGSG